MTKLQRMGLSLVALSIAAASHDSIAGIIIWLVGATLLSWESDK